MTNGRPDGRDLIGALLLATLTGVAFLGAGLGLYELGKKVYEYGSACEHVQVVLDFREHTVTVEVPKKACAGTVVYDSIPTEDNDDTI